jgi:hypothetical protein
MTYETIFEQTNHSNPFLQIIPLIFFILIGLGITYYVKKYVKKVSVYRQGLIFFGYLLGGFSTILIIISLIITPAMIREHMEFNRMIENKTYTVIEGLVENFIPADENNHFESFSVNGVIFRYSDYVIVSGFHQTTKNHGLINKNGLKVRIGYTKKDGENLILKLELAK